MRFPYLGVARLNYLFGQSVKRKLKQRAVEQGTAPEPIQALQTRPAPESVPSSERPMTQQIGTLR